MYGTRFFEHKMDCMHTMSMFPRLPRKASSTVSTLFVLNLHLRKIREIFLYDSQYNPFITLLIYRIASTYSGVEFKHRTSGRLRIYTGVESLIASDVRLIQLHLLFIIFFYHALEIKIQVHGEIY